MRFHGGAAMLGDVANDGQSNKLRVKSPCFGKRRQMQAGQSPFERSPNAEDSRGRLLPAQGVLANGTSRFLPPVREGREVCLDPM